MELDHIVINESTVPIEEKMTYDLQGQDDNNSLFKKDNVIAIIGSAWFYIGIICLSTFYLGFHLIVTSYTALQPHFMTDLRMGPIKFMLLASLRNTSQGFSAKFASYYVENRIRTSFILIFGTLMTGFGIFSNATGVYLDIYGLLVLGNILIGLSQEILNVSQYIITVKIYNDFYLNTIVSLQFAIMRLGGFISYRVVNRLYNTFSSNWKGSKKLGITIYILNSSFIGEIIIAILLSIIYEKFTIKSRSKAKEEVIQKKLSEYLMENEAKNNIKKNGFFFDFSRNFENMNKEQLLTVASASFFKPVIESFVLQMIQMSMRKFGYSWMQSLRLSSWFELIQAILGPMIGFILDFLMSNFLIVCIGLVISIFGIVLMSLTFLPFIGFIMMSIGYTAFSSSYWIIIAQSNTMDHSFNLGFGLICLSVGRTIISAISGFILQRYGYFIVAIVYIGILIFTALPMSSYAFFYYKFIRKNKK